jgi:hypothetical protein
MPVDSLFHDGHVSSCPLCRLLADLPSFCLLLLVNGYLRYLPRRRLFVLVDTPRPPRPARLPGKFGSTSAVLSAAAAFSVAATASGDCGFCLPRPRPRYPRPRPLERPVCSGSAVMLCQGGFVNNPHWIRNCGRNSFFGKETRKLKEGDAPMKKSTGTGRSRPSGR